MQAEEAGANKVSTAGELVQVIDHDGHWQDALPDHLHSWGFTNRGFEYWAVSILGCQSSGKSTLLNLLFGTRFEVMDAAMGRSQTTKGVWMGKSITGEKDILVLDVEGTDGRERGEEQKSFERKSSLFSLALAEVLIINLWVSDIGRWDAANYGLLKTVFELNLQLFAPNSSSSSKTLLFFVIRDHIKKVTPLERLTKTLEEDLARIWTGLTKSEEYAASTVRDFFDLEFTSLPHKVLEEEAFQNDALLLKERFINPNAPDYLFRSAYRKDVPADGWAHYAQSIWDTILASKDLDLPTQKEMLAIYRCDEISESAFRRFMADIEPLKEQLAHKSAAPLVDFGKTVSAILEKCLADYDGPASRYHRETAQRKRETLREKALESLASLFNLQMAKIREHTLQRLEAKIRETGADGKKPLKHFGQVRQELERECTEYFNNAVTEALVSGASWNYKLDEEDVRSRVASRLATLQETQLSLLLTSVEDKLRKKLMPQLNPLLERASSDMWRRIGDLYYAVIEHIVVKLDKRLNGFVLEEEGRELRHKEFKERAFGLLKGRMLEVAKNILYKMEKRFDEHFRLDENGLPKRWNKHDDVAGCFTQSRKMAYAVLDLYSIIRLDQSQQSFTFLNLNEQGSAEITTPSDIDPNIVVIPYDECGMVMDRFKKESEQAYVTALREQEGRNSSANIPPFFWVVMIILGFNEFWALLSNPLLFLGFVLFGGICWAVWFLGFADVPLEIASTLFSDGLQSARSWAVNTVVSKVTQPTKSDKQKSE